MTQHEHLKYLSQPLGWYITTHEESHRFIKNARSGFPTFSLDKLLINNQSRIYKGVHAFCEAEEQYGELITCAIFKQDTKKHPLYFHNLYLGPNTHKPDEIHESILKALKISPEYFQASHLMYKCCSMEIPEEKLTYKPFEHL